VSDAIHSEETPRGAHPAQVVVMFAFFSVALLGVLGLVTDLGISFAGKRSMQNAADAGAYAGARKIAKAASTSGVSAWSDVNTIATDNSFTLSSGTPTVTCVYVNDADTSLGSCSSTVPSTATGVKVTVAETHPTFFIRVIPGAPTTATTSATAIAHVRKLSSRNLDGPFMVCAVNTQLDPNGNMDIMTKSNGVWSINQAAIGKTFKIHGPQIEKCNTKSSHFKGLAEVSANKNKTAPPEQWFNYNTGTTAGQVSVDVEGAEGCKAGQEVQNCVAFLPITANTPSEDSASDKKLWTVGYAAFYITETGSNTHSGRLIGNYIVKGPTSTGWTPDYVGPIVIKLTS
jgi:Flp pilus assembly protein TadG